jgi:hypothetical protein
MASLQAKQMFNGDGLQVRLLMEVAHFKMWRLSKKVGREQPLAIVAIPISKAVASIDPNHDAASPRECGVAAHSRALDDDDIMKDIPRRRPSSALWSLPRTAEHLHDPFS